jgi:hypothetical protein
MKKYVITIAIFIATFSAFGQDVQYKKLFLSLGGGIDFPLGTSSSRLSDDFVIPSTKGYQFNFDTGWYLTPNYGIGVKYRFHKSKQKTESFSIMQDVLYNGQYQIGEYQKTIIAEEIHFIGPAVYGHWLLSKSRWMLQSSMSIGYVSDILYDLYKEHFYRVISGESSSVLYDSSELPPSTATGYEIPTKGTIGFMASAGIHYQIVSAIGIGINVEGLFAGYSTKSIGLNPFLQDYSRKIIRTGITATIEIGF